MSQSGRTADDYSPNNALPPVEPPSASFILQLFLVPGVIVAIIVMVYLMFTWLAQKGNDPESYANALERNNVARWQAAVSLANALHEEQGKSEQPLKNDAKMAQRLARILQAEIDAGSLAEQPIALRIYLCRALGEFNVPDGLPVLLQAAQLERGEEETQVRLSALAALALLSDNVIRVDPAHPIADPQLDEALLKAAGDLNPLVRSAAAYAMGVIGGRPLLDKLQIMLDDGNFDVRFNAATGLARHGDAAAVPVLVEMIDPDETEGVNLEQAGRNADEQKQSREYKRALIIVNGLRAAGQLAKANPRADRDALVAAAKKLSGADVSAEIRAESAALLKELEK